MGVDVANSMRLVVTNAGRDALKNAAGNGTNALMIESVVLGNGRYTPDAGQVWIREEHHRLKTIAGAVTGSRSLHVTVRDESRDRYSVFEIGLVTSAGVLFAVYSQNDVIIEKATGSTLLLSLDIELTDIDVKQVAFGDTNFINPAATTEMQGVVELATDSEVVAGKDGERAVTPRGVGIALDKRFEKLGSASVHSANDFEKDGAVQALKGTLKAGAYREIYDKSDPGELKAGMPGDLVTVGALNGVLGWHLGLEGRLGSAAFTATTDYEREGAAKAVKDGLGTAAYMWRNDDNYKKLGGAFHEAASTKHLVDLRNDLKASAYKSVYDGSPGDAPYSADSVASAATVRRLDDWVVALKNSISRIATSGQINDAVGVLAKEHGGLGRSDGDVDANSVYLTGTSLSSSGLKFVNVPASDGEANKICAGKDDNGSDINLESSINIDLWRGLAIRSSSAGYKTTVIIDSRTGQIATRGDVVIGRGEENSDRGLRCASGALLLSCSSGDYVRIANKSLSFHGPDHKLQFEYTNGRQTAGIVPVAQIEGLGSMAVMDMTDNADPTKLGFIGNKGISEATGKGIYERRNDGLGSAAWMLRLDDSYNKIGGNTWEVLNTKQFADHRNDCRTPGQIGSYVAARNMGNSRHVQITEIVDGSSLMPCSLAGTNESNPNARLEGGWKNAGWASDPAKTEYDDRKSTIWVRVW